MLNVLEEVFADKVAGEWNAKLKEIIPSYGTKLNGNVAATHQELTYTSQSLKLHLPQAPQTNAPAGDESVTMPKQDDIANIEL